MDLLQGLPLRLERWRQPPPLSEIPAVHPMGCEPQRCCLTSLPLAFLMCVLLCWGSIIGRYNRKSGTDCRKTPIRHSAYKLLIFINMVKNRRAICPTAGPERNGCLDQTAEFAADACKGHRRVLRSTEEARQRSCLFSSAPRRAFALPLRAGHYAHEWAALAIWSAAD